MRVFLVLAVLCGLILSVEAACDATACSSSAGVTCSAYNTYISCLQGQNSECTSTQSTSIQTFISGAEAAKTLLGCGGAMVKVSVSTLVFSLLAVFLKL